MAMRKIYISCSSCGKANTVSRDTIAGAGGRSLSGQVKTIMCEFCGAVLMDFGEREIRKRGKD